MSETSVVVRIRLPAPQLALFCLSFVWEELVEAQGIHIQFLGLRDRCQVPYSEGKGRHGWGTAWEGWVVVEQVPLIVPLKIEV